MTPCYGLHHLFDSRDRKDHREAKKLCDACPEIVACARNLAEVAAADKCQGGSPEGTWAGRLIGAKNLPKRPKKRANPVDEDGQSHTENGSLEATTERPPGGALTPSIPGASPRLDLD